VGWSGVDIRPTVTGLDMRRAGIDICAFANCCSGAFGMATTFDLGADSAAFAAADFWLIGECTSANAQRGRQPHDH
jgi:hypothetical protein